VEKSTGCCMLPVNILHAPSKHTAFFQWTWHCGTSSLETRAATQVVGKRKTYPPCKIWQSRLSKGPSYETSTWFLVAQWVSGTQYHLLAEFKCLLSQCVVGLKEASPRLGIRESRYQPQSMREKKARKMFQKFSVLPRWERFTCSALVLCSSLLVLR
jgi:hypothetical protein